MSIWGRTQGHTDLVMMTMMVMNVVITIIMVVTVVMVVKLMTVMLFVITYRPDRPQRWKPTDRRRTIIPCSSLRPCGTALLKKS